MTNKQKLNNLQNKVRNFGLEIEDVEEVNKLLGTEIDLDKFQGTKTEIEHPGEITDIDQIC